MHDQNNQHWNPSPSPYYQPQQPAGPPSPPDGDRGGGFGRKAVLTIAAIVLFFGVVGGGIAGGTIGYMLGDDGNSTTNEVVVTATPEAELTSAGSAETEESSSDQDIVAQTDDATEDDDETSSTNGSDNSDKTPADIFEEVSPAVVTIINEQQFAGGTFSQGGILPVGAGTGFIISEDGYIVSNNHVVEGSDELRVIFADGTVVTGDLIGADARTDLALIKIEGDVPGVVELGNSSELRPGEEVVAIGSALGNYSNTITAGVISGLGRQLDDLDNLVQHDAPINPGNSGGPLLNMDGEVVGVNTAVIRNASTGVSAEGLAFAVPSDTVRKIVDQLINDGQVVRPFLGITFQLLTPSLAAAENLPVDYGAIVGEITSGGAVAASGIQVGDIITKLDGQAISQSTSLQTILFQYVPGDVIDVEVYRPDSGETLSFPVTLAERPPDLD